MGRRQWYLHKTGNVPIAENQAELIEVQRRFLLLAMDEYEMDKSDVPNV